MYLSEVPRLLGYGHWPAEYIQATGAPVDVPLVSVWSG